MRENNFKPSENAENFLETLKNLSFEKERDSYPIIAKFLQQSFQKTAMKTIEEYKVPMRFHFFIGESNNIQVGYIATSFDLALVLEKISTSRMDELFRKEFQHLGKFRINRFSYPIALFQVIIDINTGKLQTENEKVRQIRSLFPDTFVALLILRAKEDEKRHWQHTENFNSVHLLSNPDDIALLENSLYIHRKRLAIRFPPFSESLGF